MPTQTSAAREMPVAALERATALASLLAVVRAERQGAPVVVDVWTGVEARALRDAIRMSLRDFGAYLGISFRNVSSIDRIPIRDSDPAAV